MFFTGSNCLAALLLRKLYDRFAPVDQDSMDVFEKLKINAIVKCEIRQPRNIGFHRKFFALLDVAYEAWEPEPVYHKGVEIHKNRERFRKDVTIMAGYFDTVVNIKGEVRLEAKSISFARMEQPEFEVLYSKTIDVILGKILTHYTKADLEEQINLILGFA